VTIAVRIPGPGVAIDLGPWPSISSLKLYGIRGCELDPVEAKAK